MPRKSSQRCWDDAVMLPWRLACQTAPHGMQAPIAGWLGSALRPFVRHLAQQAVQPLDARACRGCGGLAW